eukprot:gene10202-2621_t
MFSKKFLVCFILLIIFVGFVYCEEKKVETKTTESKSAEANEEPEDEQDDVQMNPSGHKSVQEVIDEVKKTQLKDLFVRNLNISSEDAKNVAKLLEETPEMDRFALTSNEDLTIENLKVILAAVAKTKLRVIGLTKNQQLGDEGVEVFANSIKNHPSLQKVYLFRVKMTEKSTKVLAEALSTMKNLTKVVIVENHIGDEGAKALADFVKSSNLEWITLRDCAITGEGFKGLLPSVKESKVSRIDFAENPMDEVSTTAMSEFLKGNDKFTHLDISFNKVDAKSAKILFTALESHKGLQRLDMSENSIGDEGAKALSNLLGKNSNIEKVDVSSNGIKEEGTKAILATLKKNQSLKKLFFYRNEVSENMRPLFQDFKERVIAEFTDDANQNENPTDDEEEDDEGTEGEATSGEADEQDETEDAKADETAASHDFLKGKGKETKHDEL